MIESHFKLDIFEIVLTVREGLLVDDWLVVLETTTGVDPTILVGLDILLELHKHTDLSEGVVSVADVS